MPGNQQYEDYEINCTIVMNLLGSLKVDEGLGYSLKVIQNGIVKSNYGLLSFFFF